MLCQTNAKCNNQTNKAMNVLGVQIRGHLIGNSVQLEASSFFLCAITMVVVGVF